MNLVVANIVRHMKRLGINTAELNRRAALNQTGAYDILNGKIAYPRLDTLEKIADALGVSLPSLMQPPGSAELTDELSQLMLDLPAEERARFLAMARAYFSTDNI